MNLQQLQALAASVGFPDPALAAAVAEAESGGNPNAYNTEGSYGLWQVDIVYHPEFQSDPSVLFDPVTNAKAAYRISSQGTNWQPWTTFRTGLYKQWYTPAAPVSPARNWKHAALIAAAAAFLLTLGVGALGALAWEEYKRPGLLLPWRV